MRYLLLAYGDEKKCKALTDEQMQALGRKCADLDERLKQTGRLVSSGSLSWDATTIRPKNGESVITDGPFIESHEIVGGFVIIEAHDMNEALQIAKLHPAATLGEHLGWAVEVRPMEACELLR
ncbi:MAG TPA: YciI family protein [Candidatus Limnocylindrales bacterium]|nr:YciI family protein [Candidatus Limnocylindrales bacterium]